MKRLIAFGLVSVFFIVTMVGCGNNVVVENTTSNEEVAETSTDGVEVEESALLTAIKEKGYIEIGSSNDAPFCYEDIETGELKGIDIEILKEICSRLGIADIQMKVTDFSNLLLELNNKNIDMVVDAMYVKEERLEIAAFTDKWYQEGEAVVISEDSSITSKEDLADKSVGAQPGTTFYDTVEQWASEGKVGEVVAYDNQSTLMTAVNMGQVDAVVTDGIVAGFTLAADSSLELKLLAPYVAEASGQIGAAVRFEDMDFLDEVNTVLNEMKEDGTLMEILLSYGLTEDYFVGIEEGKTENIK